MTTHSDKALATLSLMGTTAEQWTLCPIKWTKEERMVPGKVRCPDCGGSKYVRYGEQGEIIRLPEGVKSYSAEGSAFINETYRIAKSQGFMYGNCRKCMKQKRGWGGIPSGEVDGLVKRNVWVGEILWPAGTKFDSRFKSGHNCNLCNKLVMKSNLIPLIAKDAAGEWHGMWVGQDCVKKFLGNVEAIKGLNKERFLSDALAEVSDTVKVDHWKG